VLAGLSVALVLGDGPRWLVLLIFTGACAGGRFALGRALQAVAGVAVLTALLGLLTHDPVSDFGPAMFWTGMAGVLTIIVSYLRLTNRELRDAREEIAHLAIEAERLRFARDLHDLLGHDLARIALQSEVVEALVPTAPDRAIATVREMGEAARTALQEVRAAVAGYRQPGLASELRGAAEILAAAGIVYQHEGDPISAPPAIEAVLAWAVREGVTNVIRHSRARHCTVRTTQDAACAGVEVSDDGHGLIDTPQAVPYALDVGGSGLAGLSERATVLGGRCEASPRPEGGFCLSVLLPLGKDAKAATSVEEPAGVGMGGQP
jgi:two-component system sensor histidine kinase DesK